MLEYLSLMATHAEVSKKDNEHIGSLLRRFSRRSQSAGTVKRVRSIRYHTRTSSENRIKREALTRLDRTAEYTKLWKLGREPVKKGRR
jgi:ribosomal protein S21